MEELIGVYTLVDSSKRFPSVFKVSLCCIDFEGDVGMKGNNRTLQG